MAKTPRKTTLQTVLKHMKLMEERVVGEIDSLKNGQQAIQIDLKSVTGGLEKLQKSVMKQNDDLEERIDEVETVVIDHQIEHRVKTLEGKIGAVA